MHRIFLLLSLVSTACGSGESVSSDAGDSGSTSDSPSDAKDACNYPPANNDSRCPSAYSFSYQGQSCPSVGLSCAYPGMGDEVNGCFATAVLVCHGDGGVVDLDGGADAGPGTWSAAQ